MRDIWNGTGSGSLLMNETKAVTSGYSYKVTVDASVSGNSFGEISVIPKADALKYFSGTFSSVGGGTKYYLVAYRTESDGRRIEADGTLKNI